MFFTLFDASVSIQKNDAFSQKRHPPYNQNFLHTVNAVFREQTNQLRTSPTEVSNRSSRNSCRSGKQFFYSFATFFLTQLLFLSSYQFISI